jgi:hypothetical protein
MVTATHAGGLHMALAVAGSSALQPIPAGAYPRAGVLQRWRLDWPWIVGINDLQSPPGPVDWELWAGNLRTGRHIVLDRGGGIHGRSRWIRAVPTFNLAGTQVVWTHGTYALRPGVRTNWAIAIADLRRMRTTMIALARTPQTTSYANPTLAGNRLIWERDRSLTHVPRGTFPVRSDLQLEDLPSGRIVTLSRSSGPNGNSFIPTLWRNDLVFTYGQSTVGGGRLIVVHLDHPVYRSAHHWWQHYSDTVLAGDAIEVEMQDGLLTWDGGLADLPRGGTARLRFGVAQWTGGGSVVVQRMPSTPYILKRVRYTCGPSR